MLNNWYIALAIFILGFGFLVFIHELGHFLVAKFVGIRCSQFAVCFGQAVLSWRKGLGLRVGSTETAYREKALAYLRSDAAGELRLAPDKEPTDFQIMQAADRLGLGETEYRLNWIPLGGYVKMVGQEDLDPNARSQDPRAFNNKSVGARLAVISAGVIMNVISGLIFFIVAFMIGVLFSSPTLGLPNFGWPTATTYASGHDGDPAYFGLQPGDTIVAINDKPVHDMLDIQMDTALAPEGAVLTYAVQRPGVDQPLKFDVTPVYNTKSGMLRSGVIGTGTPTLDIAAVDKKFTPTLEAAGVKKGMVITAVNGKPVQTYAEFHRLFVDNPTQPKIVRFSDTPGLPNSDSPAIATYARGHDGDPNYFGLQPGDTIVAINDKPVHDMLDIQMDTALAPEGAVLTYAVQRPGVDQLLKFDVTPVSSSAGAAEASGKNTSGIEVTLTPGPPTLNRATPEQAYNLLGLAAATQMEPGLNEDGEVDDSQPAARAGVQKGDVIRSLADVDWPSLDQVSEIVKANADGVALVVLRNGEEIDLGTIVPEKGKIGVGLNSAGETNIISRTIPGTAAALLDLPPGSRLVAVENQPVRNWTEIQLALKKHVASFAAGDKVKPVTLTFQLNIVNAKPESFGVAVAPLDAALIRQSTWNDSRELVLLEKKVEIYSENPVQAAWLGVKKTNQFMVQTYMTLLRLFQGSVAASNLQGPLGIVKTGTTFTQNGWGYLLFFLGLLSVNLAVLNFLPIPIVDGGHAVFLIYEKITGTPPGEKFQTVAMILGLVLLGGLFIFVTYHDVMRMMG